MRLAAFPVETPGPVATANVAGRTATARRLIPSLLGPLINGRLHALHIRPHRARTSMLPRVVNLPNHE